MPTGLLYYDGYEDTTVLADYYTGVSGGSSIGTGRPRTGARGLRLFGNAIVPWIFPSGTSTVIVGMAINIDFFAGTTGQNIYFDLTEGGTIHVDLRFDTTNQRFVVTRNGVTLATGDTVISIDTWYYIELKVVIHDTTGSFDLRINNVTETWNAANTNVDTRNGGTGVVDRWRGRLSNTSGSAVWIDDLYIVDGAVSGADFLGDVRVDTKFPDAAGDNTDFTPSTGSNYTNVDETDPDGDTTYNESATVGHKDTFSLSDTPGLGATVYGVAHIMRARKTDAGTRELRGLLKSSGGTTTNQTTRSLSDSYVSYFQHNENVPGGTGWTESDVDGLKAGYEVVT